MDISSIIIEPNGAGDPAFFCSNYRQIFFQVMADSVVPPNQPMYCDIYIDGNFYKTMASYTIINASFGMYLFDIQDALQEYLATFINIPSITAGFQKSTFDGVNTQMSNVQCYFRGSTITSGILTPNAVVPIQGTATTPPVSGTGTPCNSFYVLNSSLIPDYENIFSSDLEGLLQQKQINGATLNTRIYSLSNRPSVVYDITFGKFIKNLLSSAYVFADDNGQFPIIIAEFVPSGSLSNYFRNCQVYIEYFSSDLSVAGLTLLVPVAGLTAGNTWYVPTGLKDILAIDPSLASILLNPANNMYYFIQIFDVDAGSICWYSPQFYVRNTSIERERLWFQNTYGNFDQFTFIRTEKNFITASSEQFEPYTETYADLQAGTFTALSKGKKRYNVRANEEVLLTVLVEPIILEWLKELFASPYVLQQSNTTSSGFRAVEVIDGTFATKKKLTESGVKYEVSIKIRPAIDIISLRN